MKNSEQRAAISDLLNQALACAQLITDSHSMKAPGMQKRAAYKIEAAIREALSALRAYEVEIDL